MTSQTPFSPALAGIRPRSPFVTIAAGGAGAVVGGAGWALALGYTGRSYFYLAAGVGMLVGWTMSQFLSSTAKWLPVVAGLISVATILVANYVGLVLYSARDADMGFREVWTLLQQDSDLRSEAFHEAYGFLDIVFVGLAALAAAAAVFGAQEKIRQAIQGAQQSAAAAQAAWAVQPPATAGYASPAPAPMPSPTATGDVVPPVQSPAPATFPAAFGTAVSPPAPAVPPPFPPSPGQPSE